jgi:hypothetical protein
MIVIGYIFMIVLTIIMTLAAVTALAYLLSLFNVFFTQGKEGAAKAVMKGGTFSHFLVWWRGHRPNDPRKPNYDATKKPWEMLPMTADPTARPSQYASYEWYWKWFERFGIYWFGFSPFVEIYEYFFKWTEKTADANDKPAPWHREEYTDFIFVKHFTYWIRLPAAEDQDNEQLDLDYLLTVQSSNPYLALFGIDDWLGRTSADANNKAKIYVGCNKFDQIKRESLNDTNTMSEFANKMIEINTNSITEPGAKGTVESYGVTITAVSLVYANLTQMNNPAVAASFTAEIVAERNAKAAVATAKGEANAARERAKGQADAIRTVYDQVQTYGATGLALRQIEALEKTATSPNNTVIWANNPLDQVAKALGSLGSGSGTPPTTPPVTPAT